MAIFAQAFRCGLPTNLLHLILRFLGEIQVLQRMAWVCKAWAAVSNSDYLWKPLLLGRRRSEQIKPQTYGMLPAINVKSNYRSWYLDWLEARAAENDLRKQVACHELHQPLSPVLSWIHPYQVPLA